MDEDRFDRLTPAQRDVLRLAADHSNGEIARVLAISRETVKTHLARAKVKLGGMDRGASSRRLRVLEARPEPSDRPSFGVNPLRGIGNGDLLEAPMIPTSEPAGSGSLDVEAVREPRATFGHFPPLASVPIIRTRFHSLSYADRLRVIASATFKVAAAVLIMLAAADALQRMVVTNRGAIPSQ